MIISVVIFPPFLSPFPSLAKSSRTRGCETMSKEKQREESWIRATEFPVSGWEREEGISMVAAFSGVVVASPILFTRHGCRHSSKGIRSRLETCLPSWGTVGECLPDTVSSTYSRVIRWNLWSTAARGWTSSSSSSSPYSKPFPRRILR